MADFGILLQYADKVRARLIAQQRTFALSLESAHKLWGEIPQSQLPLAGYQLPQDLPPILPYTITAADSSPLELSRHRAVELKAVSLARVFTDYHVAEEQIERKIVDLEKDDVATMSNPLLELEYAVGGEQVADLVLIDGSLIRWQWEQLEKVSKEKLVAMYVQLLLDSYQRGAPVLAVIDRSRSQDIMVVLEKIGGIACPGVMDEDLFDVVLAAGTFSPVFFADSPILKLDSRYKIGFVYYKTFTAGILRIEFLLDQAMVSATWVRLIDQVKKGKGYPFAIARAHDTCVVKRRDKMFLEQSLMKYGQMSQKERLKQMGS